MAKSAQAEAAEQEPTPIPRKPVRPLRNTMGEEVHILDNRCQNLLITPQHDDLQPSDTLQGYFWLGISEHLSLFSELKVVEKRKRWYQKLLVVDLGPALVRVIQLEFEDLRKILSDHAIVEIPNHTIEDLGIKGYCIKRKSDNVLIAENFPSAEAAYNYLKNHASYAGQR